LGGIGHFDEIPGCSCVDLAANGIWRLRDMLAQLAGAAEKDRA
jgi:hypothetical protein